MADLVFDLISKFLRRNGVFLFSLLLISGCIEASTQSLATDALLDTVRQELEQGKVVVVYHMVNGEQDSEQYADWSAYLNEFASSKGKQYTFHPSDKVFDDFLEKQDIDARESYTVFMKKGDATYYYDGVIVELMVYTSVDNVYSKKPLTDMDKAFLPKAVNVFVDQ